MGVISASGPTVSCIEAFCPDIDDPTLNDSICHDDVLKGYGTDPSALLRPLVAAESSLPIAGDAASNCLFVTKIGATLLGTGVRRCQYWTCSVATALGSLVVVCVRLCLSLTVGNSDGSGWIADCWCWDR